MDIAQRFFLATVVTLGLFLLPTHFVSAADPAKDQEDKLLAVLKGDSPADKALACKQLAVHGSEKAVPDLARLLTDEQLASWARIALEAIPGSAADDALCDALGGVQGNLLIGTINSIGVRRTVKGVDALASRLGDKNTDVASAAAVALGRIGNPAATKVLVAALTQGPAAVRSAVAEGCILCAERLQADGQNTEAAEVYEQIRKAEVPRQRMIEATRGAILARKEQGIPLLIEQLRSTDRGLFQMALSTARELPGEQVDSALAAELLTAKVDRAPLLIVAMADRGGAMMLPAILKAASAGPKEVRLAAIRALARIGDASCVPSLLEVASEGDAEVGQAAKQTLAELPGEGIDRDIQARLESAKDKSLPLLLEVVGERRIPATEPLLKALDHADSKVRNAALVALGNTIRPEHLQQLITQAISPKRPEDAAVARGALKVASIRMPDREACAAQLTAAFEKSSPGAKPVLLEILAAVGGAKALQTLGAAAKSSDPQLQDVSTRLLGEWMTIDAAPVLLDLSQTAPGVKFQVRALRGYIRIARQFVMPESQRVEMCGKAFAAARQTAEQKLVLDIARRYLYPALADVVVQAAKVPELRQEAAEVALLMIPKFGSPAAAREFLAKAELDQVKVEIIKAEYGNGSTQKDVTEVIRKQVGDFPLITLSGADYNSTFGGDPVPGTAKQLRVRYRINGKEHEKLFAENAPIVLSFPK